MVLLGSSLIPAITKHRKSACPCSFLVKVSRLYYSARPTGTCEKFDELLGGSNTSMLEVTYVPSILSYFRPLYSHQTLIIEHYLHFIRIDREMTLPAEHVQVSVR